MRLANVLMVAVLTTLTAADAGEAQGLDAQIAGWERDFAVTSEVVERGGRPYVTGFVHNRSGAPAWRIRLLVEALDASGLVVAQRVESLAGEIGAFSRSSFEVPTPGPASSYRVKVFVFEQMRP